LYEFTGFITFNRAVHELIFVYSFLFDRFLVSTVQCTAVDCAYIKTLETQKNIRNLKTFLKP